MEPRQIGREDVKSLLKSVGDACSSRMSVFLIGGGAMAPITTGRSLRVGDPSPTGGVTVAGTPLL